MERGIGMLIEETLAGFLDEVASDSPAPGGGSVSALSGALGAALGAMVCRLTVGKKKYADVKDDMQEVMADLDDTKKKLMLLIDMDTDAFNKLMMAFKLPKESDDEKAARKRAIQEATKEAINVPMKTCKLCLKVVELSKPIAEKGNVNSVTDAGCAVLMARSGFNGAAMNVRINLGGMKDTAFKQQTEEGLAAMEKEMTGLSKGILETVNSKL
jgi:formiminotetrahydrofolate cyclodeaminase